MKALRATSSHGKFRVADPVCLLATMASLALSMAAFMAPLPWLWLLLVAALAMLVVGRRKASPKPLFKLFVWQCVITLVIYACLWGSARLDEALLVALRIVLGFVPPWFLAVYFAPERLGGLFANWLTPRWAFVLTASIGALPFLLREAQEIYQLQRRRGARIAPRQLIHPANWLELVNTLMVPLLVELIKLSRQQALAAQSRRFGQHPRPTCWSQKGKNDEK